MSLEASYILVISLFMFVLHVENLGAYLVTWLRPFEHSSWKGHCTPRNSSWCSSGPVQLVGCEILDKQPTVLLCRQRREAGGLLSMDEIRSCLRALIKLEPMAEAQVKSGGDALHVVGVPIIMFMFTWVAALEGYKGWQEMIFSQLWAMHINSREPHSDLIKFTTLTTLFADYAHVCCERHPAWKSKRLRCGSQNEDERGHSADEHYYGGSNSINNTTKRKAIVHSSRAEDNQTRATCERMPNLHALGCEINNSALAHLLYNPRLPQNERRWIRSSQCLV